MFDVSPFRPMNEPHSHGQHDHPHDAPEQPVDSGSQALAEALQSSFGIVKVVMFVLVIVFLASGIFQVGPQERAIILRLGKPVGEGEKALLGPGLHFGFPPPIDEVKKVSITGIQKITSTAGWYYTTPTQEAAGTEMPVGPGTPLNPAMDGYLLTADGNIIHARATLQYRIQDPVRYVFGFTDASNVVVNALNNALLQSAAHFKVDQILTSDRAAFREAVRRRVTELLDKDQAGVAVEDCLVESIPPRQLKSAFENVVKASITRQKVLDEARSYENRVVSKAGADASSLTNSAATGRVQLLASTASQARWFADLLPKYQANPELFVQQRLAETFGRSLTNAEKWVQPSPTPGKTMVNWMLLNREPTKPKPAPAAP
jgi:modulator of FtsH protease HflK